MRDVIKSQQINEDIKLINGRRVRVNRRKRRSNLNNYYALAIVVSAVTVVVLSMTFFFNVKEINISGVTLYSDDQIIAVGGVFNNMNLMRTNTDIIEQRLAENLVYVDSVTVEKSYPYSIEINVVEAVKLAEIEHNGRYYLLSESGKILEAANPEHDESLPLILGFELKSLEPNEAVESKDAFKTKILTQLMDEIKNTGFKDIVTIDLTDRTDITLNYDNRIDIRLGSSVDMDTKLSYIKTVIDQRLTDEYEGTLRYNGKSSGISAIPKSEGEQQTKPAQDQEQPENEEDPEGSEDLQGTDDTASGDSDENANAGNAEDPGEVVYDGWTDNTQQSW